MVEQMKSFKDIPDNYYVSKDDSNSMIYVPVPMSLICSEEFRFLSDTAKLLYGVLFCRLNMSRNNNLCDDKHRLYVYMTISEVMTTFGVGQTKAKAMFRELSDIGGKGIGLIVKKRIGNQSSRIYVLHCKEVLKVLQRMK